MAVTKDQLTRPRVETGRVTLEGGGVVEIRPLSRKNALHVHDVGQRDGIAAGEALLLCLGMVDPAMTLEDVQEWMATDGAAGDVEAVSRGIGVISGMTAASGKESYKSAGE